MTLNYDFKGCVCHKPKRIYCHKCNKYAKSIKPIFICKYNKQTFAIVAVCEKCHNTKQSLMFDNFYEKFPSYYFDLKLSSFYNNKLKDKIGIKQRLEKDLFYIINEPLTRSY